MAVDANLEWIAALQPMHRMVFCCSCCQRLITSYHKFEQAERWGDSLALERILGRLWEHARGRSVGVDEALDFEAICKRAAPDTEQFSSTYVSAALDATAALVETTRLCRTGEADHAVAVAIATTDAISMFLEANGQVDTSVIAMDQATAEHPLMRREINKQRSDATELMRLETLSFTDVDRLQRASCYDLLAL